jgi:hypothetical protein
MQHMGFTEIESTTSNRNFIIEVERSGIPEMMRYKRLFAEYQANQQQQEKMSRSQPP